MGFLSRVLGTAVGNIVSGEISKAIDSALNTGNSSDLPVSNAPYVDTPINTSSQNSVPVSSNSFGASSQSVRKSARVPLNKTLEKFLQESNGRYTAQTGIPAELFEQQCGQQVYTHGNGCLAPEPISYLIFDNGMPALFIRTWKQYSKYNRITNREIKQYSFSHGIKMIDFFEYMPNEEEYVYNRLRSNLG